MTHLPEELQPPYLINCKNIWRQAKPEDKYRVVYIHGVEIVRGRCRGGQYVFTVRREDGQGQTEWPIFASMCQSKHRGSVTADVLFAHHLLLFIDILNYVCSMNRQSLVSRTYKRILFVLELF